MLIDKQLLVSEAQAVTASAVSTNVIDLSAYRNVGVGKDIEAALFVDEAATAAGAATVDFEIQTDDNAGFSTPTTVFKVSAVPKASIVPGYNPFAGFKLPAGVERYLRFNYTVATGPLTAGKFTGGLILASDQWRAYPNGI